MSQSHTATEQWQSFELRMRRRRLDRCLVRAAAALDAEFLEGAKDAIEEAERLSFEDPQVADLKARLQALEAIESAPLHPGALPIGGLVATNGEPPFTPLPTDAGSVEIAGDITNDNGGLADQPPASVVVPAANTVRPGRRWRAAVAAALLLAASTGAWLLATSDVSTRLQPALTAVTAWLSAQRAALTSARQPAAPAPASVHTPAPRQPAEPEPLPPADTAPAAPPTLSVPPEDGRTEPSRTAVAAGTAGTTVATEAPAPASAASRASAVAPSVRETVDRAPASTAARLADTPASRPAPPPVRPVAEATREATPSVAPPATIPPPVRVAAGAESLAARATPLPVPAITGTAAPPLPPPAATAPPTAAAVPPTAPAASPAPAAGAAVDERLVRATLSRYEAAYSGLDAAAARAVWPSVDHRALARAFEGLESQRFSLGRCDVRLNGGSAQANCTGSAQWTPKVGGGAQTAARRWQFELRNMGGEWVIVRANVR